jgi:serine/threonine-protein kinase
MTTVPRLEGKPLEQAQQIADARGLDFEIERRAFSSEVSGVVIKQSAQPGSEVEEGSAVSVVVSKGPELVDVPSVSGLTLPQARRAIQKQRLQVGKVENVFDDRVPKGHVIEQNPASGQLEVGQKIDLTVSKGREPVSVPDVVGLSEDQAGTLLAGANLQISVTEGFSATVEEGHVISQTPAADEARPVGTTVTIVVSKGPRHFSMPDVGPLTEGQAVAKLEGLALEVKVVQLPNTTGHNVVSQDPAAGKTVKQGEQVTIYVADEG